MGGDRASPSVIRHPHQTDMPCGFGLIASACSDRSSLARTPVPALFGTCTKQRGSAETVELVDAIPVWVSEPNKIR
jgi:hypothetical protein